MSLKKLISILPVAFLCLMISCINTDKEQPQVTLKNSFLGKLSPTMTLASVSEKKIRLDSSTSIRPQFIEMFTDSDGKRKFTFLNTYNESLYIYDYETADFLQHISLEKLKIPHLLAYHIKNLDSIYLYNRLPSEITLADRHADMKAKISLTGGTVPKDLSWVYQYPQFYPRTVTPIIPHNGKLLFSGEYMTAIPDSIINNFKFTANINTADNIVTFNNGYPEDLYGKGTNWGSGGLFNNVYYDVMPSKDLFVMSFPVSHYVYVRNMTSGKLDSIYAGSNFANDITSFPYAKESKKPSEDELIAKVCKTTLYTAILFDKYREIYYRFILKAIPEAKKESDWKDKMVAVIMFDKDFKYLGETELGNMKKVNWENSFVTKEGLNIEFTDLNDLEEEFLTLKIFEPTKI